MKTGVVSLKFNSLKPRFLLIKFIFKHLLMVQYNMKNSKLQLQPLTLQEQQITSQQRAQIIDRFLSIKQKCTTLSRETIFAALATYEKYLVNKSTKPVQNQETSLRNDSEVVACLWISIKIQSYEKSILTEILHFYEPLIPKQQVISAEANILQTIEFQVPLYNTYTSMILQFHKRQLSHMKNNVQLVAQCLAFYGQAIKISSDFVLDEELGAKIVDCLADRCISDSRIRRACRFIRRKRNTRNQSLNDLDKTSIAIKVCE